MKNLLTLLTFFLLFSAFKTDEKITISGFVYDQKDGKPIFEAQIKAKSNGKTFTNTDFKGAFKLSVSKTEKSIIVSFIGFKSKEVKVSNKPMKIYLKVDSQALNEAFFIDYGTQKKRDLSASVMSVQGFNSHPQGIMSAPSGYYNTESYSAINENNFKSAKNDPLSTFSIDVDAASYSNIRRFIHNGQTPPKDAVRIEEMINYFNYDYPEPKGQDPVSVTTEITSAPWNKTHRLVSIGLKAKTIPNENLPASNLVFLLDVSGSMQGPDRLDLLKTSLKLLTDQLRPNDHVAIVVYAGAAGLVLPSTSGNQKIKIKDALNKLEAGGSTAGGAGIKLAYETAKKNFIKGGNNRVILATDGDFNIGASSDGEMQRLIEGYRNGGVFLSVLGFGMGNLKDSKMETLADKGNGNYAYIDGINEAKKVLINEFGGTLFTVAKDVKLQVEFNPSKVAAYRLVGYENRLLNNEDFKDDKKDAGEMGSGHTVTALYEIIPVGVKDEFSKPIDALKYQEVKGIKNSSELLTVKLRYKNPGENKSQEMSVSLVDNDQSLAQASTDFRFKMAVAELGLLLRDSEFKQSANFEELVTLAKTGKGKDENGYRAEFIQIAENARILTKKDLNQTPIDN
ncbi:MAG: von Willebrand factor type A domain-containing protein [Bacteroidetes bacterium]|nr:von Willebrand factor type A domain-containing protein [Bacteroidota bacterium]MBU1485493.1 von Willebrand factor type A domain-containing protein [Bacteroidota bacterium]MBU2267304.1 von Willebrand factor type A domain-containing protein [Bacteroidota bacterium]MBU2376815.1 von Willebrand factor type A domain-containing protein [Bacteroidota bacterium]